MMDVEQFWALIEKTRQASQGDSDKQADLLITELTKSSEAEILAYQSILDDLMEQSYIAELWDMAGIMAAGWGCSDDGFMDFRAWLIGQGREVFEKALNDPESLSDTVEVDQKIQGESLLYVAMKAYEHFTGKDIEAMPIRIRPTQKLKGQLSQDRESTKAHFPKATAKYLKW